MSKKKFGVLIIIIFIIFLLGGIYFYKTQRKENEPISIPEIEYEAMESNFKKEPQKEITSEVKTDSNKSLTNNSQNKVKKEKTDVTIEKKTTEQVKETPQAVETPKVQKDTKTEEPKTISDTPKQEQKVYCVDGGKTHIYGDGANEHGYYKTWDEAFRAYEEYTKGWESTQFKIDQCACGLYYFWVIK